MSEAISLLRASVTMMLRSRGVIFAMVAIPVQVVAFALLGGLGFGFSGQRVAFVDFVVPGMAALLPVTSLQDTTVALAASFKARSILRRLAATPASPALFIASQITSYVALGVAVSVVALAIGSAMGTRLVVGAGLLWLVPLSAIAVLTALSIAFTIAGLTSDPPTANIVSGAVVLPLFALTGAILPVSAMPAPLPDVVPYVLPYAALIDAFRGIALTGASIATYGREVLIGVAWLVVMFLVASRAYRFDRE